MPTNDSLVSGSAIYANVFGYLTPDALSAGPSAVVGRFIEFETTAISLVNTPASLVGATNAIEHAVFNYRVE